MILPKRARAKSQKAYTAKIIPESTKRLAAFNVIHKIWTYKVAALVSDCAPSQVQKYVKQLVNGQEMHAIGGQPAFVTAKQTKSMIAAVAGTATSSVKISKRTLTKMLQTAADITSIARNKPCKKLSARFGSDFQIKNDIHEGNAEVIDNAHLTALNDPRHALAFAAMHHFLHKSVKKGFFVSFDKTRFDLPKSEQKKARAVYLHTRPQSVKCAAPNTKNSQGNCSVGLFMVVNDTGKLADLVFVVKVNSMPKDAIDVHRAPTMDISNSTGSTAYIMFVGETTHNNDSSLEWLMYNIVMPFIDQLRCAGPANRAEPVNLQVDGDPKQLQVLAGANLQQSLRFRNITLSKNSASCTPTEAPLDEGHMFLAPKTRFRALVKHGYAPDSVDEVDALKAIFRAHLQKYPTKHNKNSKPSLALGRYFADIIKCLYTAAEALRHSAVCSLVQESFKTAGISPFNPSVIRDKCQFDWSAAQKKSFLAAVPVLAKCFETNYELKEKDFSNTGIPATQDSKDELDIHRRRALFLHAPLVLKKLRDQAEKAQTSAE